MPRRDDLERIREALEVARRILADFTPGDVPVRYKRGDDPLTEADTAIDTALREFLPRVGEGWLSEETPDDSARLGCARVWVVDPIDGTREFVRGRDEWCVSVGLVEHGRAVAGGILNAARDELFLGGEGLGLTRNGAACSVSARPGLGGGVVLASRSESRRGEWDRFAGAEFSVRAVGSVAYKLALVAAGRADATWTLVPKCEWDVAAGVALVQAASGSAVAPDGAPLTFNRKRPRLSGVVAGGVAAVVEALGLLRSTDRTS